MTPRSSTKSKAFPEASTLPVQYFDELAAHCQMGIRPEARRGLPGMAAPRQVQKSCFLGVSLVGRQRLSLFQVAQICQDAVETYLVPLLLDLALTRHAMLLLDHTSPCENVF